SVGANHRPASQRSKASRAARRSSLNGTNDSGGIISAADSGRFSRCVPQYGHFSVTTLSSSSTSAPQPVQRTCDDRPAMVEPPPCSSRSRYSLKSRSTTASSASAAGTFVSCPQYGHFRDRLRGSNSTLAPHCAHGNSFPAGGAFGGDESFGMGGVESGIEIGKPKTSHAEPQSRGEEDTT